MDSSENEVRKEIKAESIDFFEVPIENGTKSVNEVKLNKDIKDNVSWVMEFLTCGYKMFLILSKILMVFKEIAVFRELT